MEQIVSLDEIARVAQECWDRGDPCPYPEGSLLREHWLHAYANCAAEALSRQVRANRAALRRNEVRE